MKRNLTLLTFLLVCSFEAIDFDDLGSDNRSNQSEAELNTASPNKVQGISQSKKLAEALAPEDLSIQVQLPGGISRFPPRPGYYDLISDRPDLPPQSKKESVFQAGDDVEINLHIRSPHVEESQRPAKAIFEFDGKKVEKSIDGIQLRFPANEILGQQLQTSNQSFLIFKTTKSRDTEYFFKALVKARSEFLPSEKVAFYDDHASSSVQEQPADKDSLNDLSQFDPLEIFDAGGLKIGTVKIFDRQARLIKEKPMAVQRPADWIYYSGHYSWHEGGMLGGGGVDPWTIRAKNWREHLEVLIMASCYSLDVNDPNGVMEEKTMGIRVGVNGSEWWRKFEGTALGYGGVAPSGGVDAEVAANLVQELAKSGIARGDEKTYSKKLAETWMKVNNTKFKATAAAAMDAEGNYYFVPSKGAKIGGLSIRPSIMNWTVVGRDQWEPENAKLLRRSSFNEHISLFISEQTTLNRGGKPYTPEEALQLPGLRDQVKKAELDPDSEEFGKMLTKLLEYQAHIFYDLPSFYTYSDATQFLGVQLMEDRPVTVDELRAFFTHPTQPNRSQYLPDRTMRKIIIKDYVRRVTALEIGARQTPPNLEFILSKFEGHLELTKADIRLVKRTLEEILRESMTPNIDDSIMVNQNSQ